MVINVYFRIADHYNIIDKPNERSSHSNPTIRGGGILFFFGGLLSCFTTGFQFPYFLIGLLLIATISFIDDIQTVASSIRLLIHLIAVLLLFYQLNLLTFPWWTWIITLIITIGIINAYNFMDGINGITGGYSLAVLAGIWWVNNYQFAFIDNGFIYCIVLALLVFNFYNFRKKARCFAGDVGSVSIAFILIFLLGKLIFESGNIYYLLFLTLYGVDSVLTIIQRIYLRENIFEAHRRHFYQVLANEGRVAHTNVALGYGIVQLIINAVIIFSIDHFRPNSRLAMVIVILILLTLVYISIKPRYIKKEKVIAA